MCGRYFIPEPEDNTGFQVIYEQLKERFAQQEPLSMKRGEIFPTNIVPIITSEAPALMKWGFTRFGGKGQVINARLETASEKAMFKNAYAYARCLVPAMHYFEWRREEDGGKRKYALSAAAPDGSTAGVNPSGGRALFTMAGLYRIEPEASLPAFVILTRPAAAGIAFIHHRMPVIVPEAVREKWLREAVPPDALLAESAINMEYRDAV